MSDIKATGQIRDGRVTAVLDFGHGTLTLDLDQASMVDDEKTLVTVDVVQGAEDAFADVFEALAAGEGS